MGYVMRSKGKEGKVIKGSQGKRQVYNLRETSQNRGNSQTDEHATKILGIQIRAGNVLKAGRCCMAANKLPPTPERKSSRGWTGETGETMANERGYLNITVT